MCTSLGLHGAHIHPVGEGRDYTASRYLHLLDSHREDFTYISGLSHPEVGGGHASEASFLTAAPHPNQVSFRNSVSLDQVMAEQVSGQTRWDYLSLSLGPKGLSWTRNGVPIPPDTEPSRVFVRLFLEGSKAEQQLQLHRLEQGQSILDGVREQTRMLSRRLGAEDRDGLDQYLTSIRELEVGMTRRKEWIFRPKPRVDLKWPEDIADPGGILGRTQLLFDLLELALQTDSTRVISVFLQGNFNVPKIHGVSQDWHGLSHHGRDPERIRQLTLVEEGQMRLLNRLLGRLAAINEGGKRLLDHTSLLFGSNLGNASSHDTTNVPVLLAGGGYRHGRHLAFDPGRHPPLANLYVSLLQKSGLEIDRFGSSTGTLEGLS